MKCKKGVNSIYKKNCLLSKINPIQKIILIPAIKDSQNPMLMLKNWNVVEKLS